MFVENCYLIVDEEAGACAIVDPGEEAGLILHKVQETGARPVGIWLTHAHLDHVLGVARVAAETGVPVWLHPADRPLYDAVPEQAAWFGLAPPGDLLAPDHDLSHCIRLSVGNIAVAVRPPPGHAPTTPSCTADMDPKRPLDGSAARIPSSPASTGSPKPRPRCMRCGAEVQPKPWGCKNPCPNCGFLYPLGDCSD